jgi:general secretion pathway protein G
MARRLTPLLKDARAFSLVETLVACALVSTLASIGAGIYVASLETARVARAIGDIEALATDITVFRATTGAYPATLGDVRRPVPLDPWGNPYVYVDLSDGSSKTKGRKDRKLTPINHDFDLYSLGKDGRSVLPLTARASLDDVVRAGAFIGLARDF